MAFDRNGNADRVKVLLDTNALLMPVQFKIDIFEEIREILGNCRIITIDEVMDELKGIAKGSGKDASAARFGSLLASRIEVVPSGSQAPTVDEKIVEFAMNNNCLVVTNDRGLKKRLLSKDIGVLSMRNQKKLELRRG